MHTYSNCSVVYCILIFVTFNVDSQVYVAIGFNCCSVPIVCNCRSSVTLQAIYYTVILQIFLVNTKLVYIDLMPSNGLNIRDDYVKSTCSCEGLFEHLLYCQCDEAHIADTLLVLLSSCFFWGGCPLFFLIRSFLKF